MLPVQNRYVVNKKELEELTAVMSQGVPHADLPEWADHELELLKEVSVFLQELHEDNKHNSFHLARAVCACSVIRARIRDGQPLEDMHFDPYSRFLPKVKILTMESKLAKFSKPMMNHKYKEMVSVISYWEKKLPELEQSLAWCKILWPVHVLMKDTVVHCAAAFVNEP